MNRISTTLPRTAVRLAAGALLLSCSALAQAQYMWIDAKGMKQVSDRPPPPTVPYKDILKAPIGQYSAKNMPPAKGAAGVTAIVPTTVTEAPRPVPAPPGASEAKAAPTLAEREADYLKRQKEKAEKDKKEADEKTKRTAQAEYCLKVASNKAALDQGIRLSTVDKNGERVVIDDEQRAAESKKASAELASCKNI